MHMKRGQEARDLLEQYLHSQERLQQENAEDPEASRNAGIALCLLSRPEEAERSFHQALARDRHCLAQAETDAARAQVQVLLGKTLFYTGDREAAEEHYAQAHALSPGGRERTGTSIAGSGGSCGGVSSLLVRQHLSGL